VRERIRQIWELGLEHSLYKKLSFQRSLLQIKGLPRTDDNFQTVVCVCSNDFLKAEIQSKMEFRKTV
jgi:hypothetical protein